MENARKVSQAMRRRLEIDGLLLRRLSLLYFFAVPLDIVPTPAGTPASWAALVFLGFWSVGLVRGSVKIPSQPVMHFILAALVTWSLATVFWSYAPEVSVSRSVTTLLLVLSAIGISSGAGESALRPAAAMALGSAVAAVAAIISEPDVTNGRATFLGIDQNVLAFHLALGLASAFFVLLNAERRRGYLAAILLSALIVVALVLVGSRTGIGATIALAVTFVFLSLHSRQRAVVATVALGAALLGIWGLVQAGLVPPRVIDWLETPALTDNREEIIGWFRLTQDEWIIKGIGAGADANYLEDTQSVYKNAHSAVWKVLIELGAIGLGLWFLMLVGLGRRALRSSEWVFFLLASLPIVTFFYTLGPINSNMLWAVFGLALGAAPLKGPPHQRARGHRDTSKPCRGFVSVNAYQQRISGVGGW